ncbi:MAG: Branched-chain-amino-acid transaminase [Solirubrobacterales bacterium]|nr:Branched-chain-amino-acid transaminase [Solirubrobacterales bacterium]
MTGAATHRPATPPGTSGWQIRPAGPEDAAAVATGVAALLCELGATPPSHASIEAEARAHIEDPSLGIVLIAVGDGEELVGVLTASWARAIQVPGRMLTIEVLWTRREWRGRTVGAGLVEALAQVAVDVGAARVEVGLPRESFEAIRATERFYLDNGFERLGPRMRKAIP